jgi:hypothetical protein
MFFSDYLSVVLINLFEMITGILVTHLVPEAVFSVFVPFFLIHFFQIITDIFVTHLVTEIFFLFLYIMSLLVYLLQILRRCIKVWDK